MNNKRQTIWLVSMLSLMVILSAYYLFTEDAPKTGSTASGIEQTKNGDDDMLSADDANGVSITQEETATGTLDGTAAPGDKQATSDDPSGISPEDQEVLKGIANSSGNQQIEQKLLDQREKISLQAEQLRNIIAGTSKVTQEESAKAVEDMTRLEETDERITSLQSKLLQEYDNAVVEEEDLNNFKVIVLSDKLEKKQAIGILDLATKELNVTPDRVTIQYVQ
ncbi:SpoIIIAH-like family protein [Cohnella suwonensis]|uniref:SpoIIIAH-like family protein n=1 Tax=Cohnella suwonensis TaxID=696072 RepID=A0ABW0LSY3_9BACL